MINTAVCCGFDNCCLMHARGKKLILISSDTCEQIIYSQLCIKFKPKGYFLIGFFNFVFIN